MADVNAAAAPPPAAHATEARSVPVAALEKVTFTYQDGAVPALRDISLTLKPGMMIGVMGASGAGKSTMAKCLNRIVPAFEGGNFSGIVAIGNRPLDGARVADAAPLVGMVFQDFEAQLFSTNVTHEVAFAMEQIGLPPAEIRARIGPALDAVGLPGFGSRDPTSLSGGEKQRLAIAAVLALRPPVIVLDEPTTDLDPQGRDEVFRLIDRMRAEGLSLIIFEHEAAELVRCDHIIILDRGSIVLEGQPEAVMTQLDQLEHCGVHPPDLNRILAGLGVGGHAASAGEAERMIRAHIGQLPSPPAPKPPDSPADLIDGPHRAPPPIIEAAADPPARPRIAVAEGDEAPLIEVEDLKFGYAFGPTILNGVRLAIKRGEFLAIIGQNGSGKTTLAKLIVGLLKPASGRIKLSGRDRATLSVAATAREAAYVFQNPDHQIFAATVEDEVAFGPRNFGLDAEEVAHRCDEVLRAVNLDDQRTADPFLLSKGERQRLAVASVLALRPRVLILDEPTTGLDYREQRRMMALVSELNRAGIAIVMITHTPWLVAEYARRVVLMRHGQILYDGGVHGLFNDEALLKGSSFILPPAPALARRMGLRALTPSELIAELLRCSKTT